MLSFSDLTGKMFTFAQDTRTDHVKLIAAKDEVKAITVCLRYVRIIVFYLLSVFHCVFKYNLDCLVYMYINVFSGFVLL